MMISSFGYSLDSSIAIPPAKGPSSKMESRGVWDEAPLEAQEASAETNEVSDDTLTGTHHAKETITEGIAETETYTDEKQE